MGLLLPQYIKPIGLLEVRHPFLVIVYLPQQSTTSVAILTQSMDKVPMLSHPKGCWGTYTMLVIQKLTEMVGCFHLSAHFDHIPPNQAQIV